MLIHKISIKSFFQSPDKINQKSNLFGIILFRFILIWLKISHAFSYKKWVRLFTFLEASFLDYVKYHLTRCSPEINLEDFSHMIEKCPRQSFYESLFSITTYVRKVLEIFGKIGQISNMAPKFFFENQKNYIVISCFINFDSRPNKKEFFGKNH